MQHLEIFCLLKTGGTLTGTLTGQLIKSIRNTGYAIEISKPNDGPDTKAFIRN